MWWIPVIVGGAWVLKKVFEDDSSSSGINNQQPQESILEKNLLRLKQELADKRVYSIAVVGQPGAGKSSLIDQLSLGKCNPRPTIGQGTDATDWSKDLAVPLYNQYCDTYFIDTPGYDTSNHPLKSYLNYFPFANISKVIFTIKGKLRQADESIFEQVLSAFGSQPDRVLLVRTYAEGLSQSEAEEIADDLNERLKYRKNSIKLVFLSNRTQNGIQDVSKFLGCY